MWPHVRPLPLESQHTVNAPPHHAVCSRNVAPSFEVAATAIRAIMRSRKCAPSLRSRSHHRVTMRSRKVPPSLESQHIVVAPPQHVQCSRNLPPPSKSQQPQYALPCVAASVPPPFGVAATTALPCAATRCPLPWSRSSTPHVSRKPRCVNRAQC